MRRAGCLGRFERSARFDGPVRGFTLVELLLAVAMSAFVVIGIAALLAGATEARDRGELYGEMTHAARHLADRIDRLLASADPTTVAVESSTTHSPWIEVQPSGSVAADARVRLDGLNDGSGRVFETRAAGTPSAQTELLLGPTILDGRWVRGARVGELWFRPVSALRSGVATVHRVEVQMTVQCPHPDGTMQVVRRWFAPVWVGQERMR